MIISDLIKELEELKIKHGDIELYVTEYDGDMEGVHAESVPMEEDGVDFLHKEKGLLIW